MPSTHQIDGPAEQETLKWIQSHIAQLNSSVRCSLTNWSGDTASSMLELSISSIYLENGQLTVVVAEGYYVGSIPSLNLSSGRSSSTKYTIAIADLDGGVEINRSETSGRDCTCSPSICQELWFFSKPNKVVEISTSIYESVGGKVKLDGTEIDSALQNPADEVKRRAINGQGKQSTGSAFIIPVNPEMAERFKKAFDRLIQLHSDDKPEAF